jgi:hypothetical protein
MWLLPQNPFRVMKNEIPILDCSLPKRVRIGITYGSRLGLVADLEEREAAIFGNYNYSEWLELPWNERAEAVAHYRLHSLIEAHTEDAVEKARARASKGRKRG